jgi:RNA polymerase sigma-54 factor
MKLDQHLAPQVIQSLKLLQVNTMQLEAMVQEELETNPLLERQEDVEEQSASEENKTQEEGSQELSKEEQKEDVDWDAFFEDTFEPKPRGIEDRSQEQFERVPVATKSLQDHLFGQLQLRHLSADIRFLVEYLIDSLDDDGYLRVGEIESEQLIAAGENQGVVEIQEVLLGTKSEIHTSKNVREAFSVLRHLEPAGIGARDLQECLLLQMERYGNCSVLAQKIIQEAYDLFEKVHVGALAKQFEVTPREVQGAIEEIGHLDPKPGRVLGASVAAAIIPDLLVEEVDGDILLQFNDRHVPSLHVSKRYSHVLQRGSSASKEEKEYVRERLNSASWLIKAIEQRKSTIAKVMHTIIKRQPDFFAKGPTYLKPLVLQDVADEIEMHISTVSRVINGKYVQTSHGVFELKYFFTSATVQNNEGEVLSIQVKQAVQNLVQGEDTKKPLSDQKIVDALKEQGIQVARRTVAKYREQMGILPARMRKRF